jgi:endonuclease/exonuclease/phosphatase family metal-dependent hydrolase
MAILGLLMAYASTWISPENIWWLALFGLTYPIILAVNLLFIIWWLLFKRMRSLYSLVAIIIGFNHLFSFIQYNGSGEPLFPKKKQFKIMTFNVRLFDLYNWKGNKISRNHIFELIKKEDPDVICFQEFFYQGIKGIFETRDTLTTFLKAKNVYEGYTHKLVQKQFFGLATFSAFPVVYSGMISFPNDKNNNAIYTDLKIGNDTVRIYNVHLASFRFQQADYEVWGDKEMPKTHGRKDKEQHILARLRLAYINRVAQTRTLIEHIDRSPYPVMVCGDFNDTPVSYTYSSFSSRFTDAFAESGSGIGATYSGRLPGLRIDYIFYDEHIHTWNYHSVHKNLSDHYPVICNFQLK